jgi:hypothetical protein
MIKTYTTSDNYHLEIKKRENDYQIIWKCPDYPWEDGLTLGDDGEDYCGFEALEEWECCKAAQAVEPFSYKRSEDYGLTWSYGGVGRDSVSGGFRFRNLKEAKLALSAANKILIKGPTKRDLLRIEKSNMERRNQCL